MTTIRFRHVAAVTAALALGLASAAVDAKPKVKVGFIGPLSGGTSSNGIGGRNSADLAVRLRNLVAHDILETVPASDGSAYQDYVLTEKGRALFPLLVALRQWGEAFCFAPDEAHVVLVDKATGKPVPRLELRAQDGRALAPEDTVVVHPSAIRPTKRQRAKAS